MPGLVAESDVSAGATPALLVTTSSELARPQQLPLRPKSSNGVWITVYGGDSAASLHPNR